MPPADPLIVNPVTIMVGGLPVGPLNPLPVTGGSGTGLATLGANAFTGNQTPATNDGAALGTGALSWSDLFLASGGVINFANGAYTITQAGANLAFSGTATIGGIVASSYLQAATVYIGTAASDTALTRLGAGSAELNSSTPGQRRDLTLRSLIMSPPASVTPASNGDIQFEFTNNTTLTIKAKGSDGTVRSATIVLA